MPAASLTSLYRRAARSMRPQRSGRPGGFELLVVPPSLRPADDLFLAEWSAGSFALAGHSLDVSARSPLELADAPLAWMQALHGFGWLRHVPLFPDSETANRVHALVAKWLSSGRRSGIAMSDAVVARRVLSWLAHADLLLQTPDSRFYDAVVDSLADDVRLLERNASALAPGADRVVSLIALAQAGLCLSGSDRLLHDAEKALEIDTDPRNASSAGDLWRHPDRAVECLLDLETLRLLYVMAGLSVPAFLQSAVAATARRLGSLSLGDGHLARLGSARSAADADLTLTMAVRYVGLPDVAACHDPIAGHMRLALGRTCAILDVGAPYDCADALGMEMSSGDAPFLVHDGFDTFSGQAGRATLVLNCLAPSKLPPAPTLEPTHTADLDLADATVQRADATHAGFLRRGLAHRRRVTLACGGRRLAGMDELRPLAGRAEPPDQLCAVRFVTHPSVEIAIAATPSTLDIKLRNGHRWRLEALGHDVSVEGAVYRDGLKTRPTLQILIMSNPATGRSVNWNFTRMDGLDAG